jgi:hypothetical protein
MSLEMKIDALTAAVTALTAVLAAQRHAQTVTVAAAPQVPTVAATLTVPVPAPVVAAPVAASVAMPPPPVFSAPPVAAPAAPAAAPFTDQKSLITYVMGAYSALGPQKGAQIQTVLTGLGCTNINDVKPEQYAALFAGVEALKAG